MREVLWKVVNGLRVFYGVIFALAAVGGVIATAQSRQWEMLLAAGVPFLLSFLLLRKRKSAPDQTANVLEPVQIAEPVDAYIKVDNVVYRTDGKPISDREVPYLIAQGYQDILNDPGGVPADATKEERFFLECLENALVASGKSPYFRVTRMSTKALSVNSNRAYLGKIKLQGRKTWMQYMTGLYSSKTVENAPLEKYIDLIRYWVKAA